MTKFLLRSISVLVLGVCMVQMAVVEPAYAQQVRRFGGSYTAKKQEAEDVVYAEARDLSYKGLVLDAVALHNFAADVRTQMEEARDFKKSIADKNVDVARLENFEACQVQLLAPYFKNPKDVWNRLKKAAEAKMEENALNWDEKVDEFSAENASAIALTSDQMEQVEALQADNLSLDERVDRYNRANASDVGLTAEQQNKVDAMQQNAKRIKATKGASVNVDEEDTFADLDEGMMEWKIGYSVLNDFYANQDKWGERKSKTTPSLPLWTDQKHLYNRDVWKKRYKEIRHHCEEQGVELSVKEPKVDDVYKYDYNAYDKVESAHAGFIASATAQGCVLVGNMAAAPAPAPRPLPPVEEEVFLMGRSTESMSTPAPHAMLSTKANIPVLTETKNVVVGVYPEIPKDMNGNARFVSGTLWEKYKADEFDILFVLNIYFPLS